MSIVPERSDRLALRQLFKTRFGIQVRPRKEFIDDLKAALERNTPYAVGRLGISEKHWMHYPALLEEQPSSAKRKAFEMRLLYHGMSQVGIFPAQTRFYLRYNQFFVDKLRDMDWLGLVLEPVLDPRVIHYYHLASKLIYHLDMIPDKSIPNNPDNCYVQYFAGKKILIVCPFGEFLKERATQETFEGVWSKTGKKWFYPSCVDALEFPYGFDIETHKMYSTAFDLFEHIRAEIATRDFDIALIAAAGLSVPIASVVKGMGKIAIDLGGELQFLFGVIGKRWRDEGRWVKGYFTDWWIDVPAKYRPKQKGVAGAGAFW